MTQKDWKPTMIKDYLKGKDHEQENTSAYEHRKMWKGATESARNSSVLLAQGTEHQASFLSQPSAPSLYLNEPFLKKLSLFPQLSTSILLQFYFLDLKN